MHYQGNIIRPPSEADSIILQVTVGCSHNRCTFCGAYRDPEQKFHIKDEGIIDLDLEFASQHCRRLKTVFLADGDALVIPQTRLLGLFSKIHKKLPWIRRISLYANCRNILSRLPEELAALKAAGLGRIYMGLESGHEETLRNIRKGATATEMIAAGRRVRAAGIFLSVTCLLGIGGLAHSRQHAEDTATVLSQMQPNQIAVLTLMLLENTELGRAAIDGTFHLPDQAGLFQELRTMLAGLEDFRCQFQANLPPIISSWMAAYLRTKIACLPQLIRLWPGLRILSRSGCGVYKKSAARGQSIVFSSPTLKKSKCRAVQRPYPKHRS